MGLLSQTQCFLPCNSKALHSWSAYQRIGWPTWRQDYGFGYLVFWPGLLVYVGDQTSSPCMGWWGLITSSTSQHYSHLYTIASLVFGGRWAVLSMLRGNWPLWWWLASSPESKRHFGGSVRVGKHLFPRSDLFYWVSYHITLFPILQCWKGEVPFCKFAPPLFAVLHFPMLWQSHHLCTVSQHPVHWISRVYNRCRGLEILVSARTKS